ncbi:MAG: CAP domain-containing protein [Acidobacteriota bacterium]
MVTTRRSFLSSAVRPMAIAFALSLNRRAASAPRQLAKDDFARFRDELLKLVNSERGLAGASSLALDDLACRVADQHALDMATGKFLSHWGRDGRKPYQRYADAGAPDATQENVSAADELEALSPEYIAQMLARMDMKMYAEVPPNDGHRRTILAPQHTHAGFGIALANRDLRLVELYVGKHVRLDPYPTQAKPKATVQLSGKLLNPGHQVSYAEIFFEPPPSPPGIDWLRAPRPYSLPDESKAIRLIAPIGTQYADGVIGEIEAYGQGRFRMPVKLFKSEPGVYTVVIYLSERGGRKKFGATNICIHAD